MTDRIAAEPVTESRWTPERARWKQMPINLGMRTAGWLAVGLQHLLGSRAVSRPGILTYHRNAEHVARFPAPLHNVAPDRFAEQLKGLLKRGYQFLPLSRVLAAAEQSQPLPARSVVITFDDGFATVFTQAWPLLKELSIPATVFISTAYLDSNDPFPFDAWGVAHKGQVSIDSYRPLRTDECHEMIESGLIEIGAHTHTHEDFRGRPESFQNDLVRSMEIVRERFRCEDVTFAFPYGSRCRGYADGVLASMALQAGARCGLTTVADVVDLSASPYCWGRFNVFAWDTATTLAAKLDGWYSWVWSSWAPRARQAMGGKVGLPLSPNPSRAARESEPFAMKESRP